MVTAVCI